MARRLKTSLARFPRAPLRYLAASTMSGHREVILRGECCRGWLEILVDQPSGDGDEGQTREDTIGARTVSPVPYPDERDYIRSRPPT
jgi:hypothetical protein